jgi:hypothetical protein
MWCLTGGERVIESGSCVCRVLLDHFSDENENIRGSFVVVWGKRNPICGFSVSSYGGGGDCIWDC